MDLLKSRISNLVHNAFRKKDGSVRYTHIKLTRAKGYFTHDINGDGENMFTADSICKMIEFCIDNIFVQFGGRLFRQVIGIPMGTNCSYRKCQAGHGVQNPSGSSVCTSWWASMAASK